MSGDRKPWGTFDRNGRLCSRHKTKIAAERAAMRGESVRRIVPGETYESTKPKARPVSRPVAVIPYAGRPHLDLGVLAAIAAAGLMGRRR